MVDKNSKKKNVWYYDVAKSDNDCSDTPVDPSTVIDDDVTSTDKTWSSTKIMEEILKAVNGNLNENHDGSSSTDQPDGNTTNP